MMSKSTGPSFQRDYAAILAARLGEQRRLLHVVAGPRQVGKTTLAHYLELLAGAGMLTGLPKFAGAALRSRGSSPKLQVFNTALLTAQAGLTPVEARADHEYWGA